MTEPRTQAGRDLLRKLRLGPAWDPFVTRIEAEAIKPYREALDCARLVAQWCDSIGSGPIEELNEELRELGRLVAEVSDAT